MDRPDGVPERVLHVTRKRSQRHGLMVTQALEDLNGKRTLCDQPRVVHPVHEYTGSLDSLDPSSEIESQARKLELEGVGGHIPVVEVAEILEHFVREEGQGLLHTPTLGVGPTQRQRIPGRDPRVTHWNTIGQDQGRIRVECSKCKNWNLNELSPRSGVQERLLLKLGPVRIADQHHIGLC